jgi:hypothetical protein
MKNILIIVCYLITATQVTAQSVKGGLYGKTRFVEFSANGNYCMLSSFRQPFEYYKTNSSNTLVSGKDNFNYGFQLGVGITVKKNVAINLQSGIWFSDVAGPSSIYGGNYTYPVRHENLNVRTLSFLPVINIAEKSALLPVGFSHEIGIGYTVSQIVEKDYVYQPREQYTYIFDNNTNQYISTKYILDSLEAKNGSFIDYSKKYKGFTAMYGLKFRTPIGKNLLINYGLRYTLNLVGSTEDGYNSSNDYGSATSYETIRYHIRKAHFRNVLSLNVGVTYAF